MEFLSTRGAGPVSFGEAVFRGLAPDGGLWLPAEPPALPREVTARPSRLTFEALAVELARPFLAGEFKGVEIERIVAASLGFPVPWIDVSPSAALLELWHGPTLAFKDFGARFMAEVVDALSARRGERVTILVATSGDTGGAVAHAFAGRRAADVVVLFPRGRVSALQELQLTAERPGVRAIAVMGTFDDCQALVKAAFAEPRGLALTSANSINIARLIPQTCYYGRVAAECERRGPRAPDVCVVPSGNLGNLTAGVLARSMGLRLPRFVAASNANDALPRFLAGEEVEPRAAVPTCSNAMDVGKPSNLERLVALFDGDSAALRRTIDGVAISDEATLATMATLACEHGVHVDPHTAVGLAALETLAARGVVLSTAHPAKFPEVAVRAGVTPATHPTLEALRAARHTYATIEPDLDALFGVLSGAL